ncbi:hypothetical protein EW146_g609 [Bondarzewia mesenterica]|uniref:Uncharacterized protein n=1 Tax=Bondarzewia mesenterica TaxID=1095465 RepID=A0A4S4M8P1_9AGAM|nr:hypothetical protein EW146_g609 [Bondarzewia mesenterica]
MMLKVLAHLSRRAVQSVSAQYLVNGQVFTNALAILDAPAPQSTYHAGNGIPIAIDVSGDGKLPNDAAIPDSNLATGFDSLELYLVSTSTGMNLTVSNGTGLLTQESGSTVKHLDFALSNCVPAGEYNFTLYEGSHINNEAFYSITPIPISIENNNFNGTCPTGLNELQSLPQPSTPPPNNPFLNSSSLTPLDTTANGSPTVIPSYPSGIVTLTIVPSGVILPSPYNTTWVPYSSGGAISMPTWSIPIPTPTTATVTLVLVSEGTITETQTVTSIGFTSEFTTVFTTAVTSTSTAEMRASGDLSGFFPVNSASSLHFSTSLPALLCIFAKATLPPGSFTTMSAWQSGSKHASLILPTGTSTFLQSTLLTRPFPTPPPDLRALQTCCEPNIAVVELTTTVTISDYHRFYQTPIQDFRPTYFQLADGSLLATPFKDDLRLTYASSVILGIYLLLFLRNIIVSFGFIRRMKVKNKDLLHMLLASQLLAPAAWTPMIAALFDDRLNCTTIVRITALFASISSSILIIGIFGIKAYRCLNNARFVLVVLALLQIANSACTIIDLVRLDGVRKLSGNCDRYDDSVFLPIITILIFVESFFICCCFIYAVWKSSRFMAAQGRLSYRLSMDTERERHISKEKDDSPTCVLAEPTAPTVPEARGWWDYVPRMTTASLAAADPQPCQPTGSYLSILPSRISSLWKKHLGGEYSSRKPSIHSAQPISQPPNLRLITQNVNPSNSRTGRGHKQVTTSPISHTRLTGIKPRVLLFREVMRDELCYTAFVTATSVVSAVLGVIGVSHQMFWSANGWLGVHWAVISLLAVHSFGRVVKRHEQEALYQDPNFWDPRLRAEQNVANTSGSAGVRGRAQSPSSSVSSRCRPSDARSPPDLCEVEMAENHYRSYQSFNSSQSFVRRVDSGSSSWDLSRSHSVLDRHSTASASFFPSPAPLTADSDIGMFLTLPRPVSIASTPMAVEPSPGLSSSGETTMDESMNLFESAVHGSLASGP